MHERAIATLTDAPREVADRPETRYELARSWYTLGQRDMLQGPRGGGPGGPGHGPGRRPPDGPGRRPPPDRPDGPRHGPEGEHPAGKAVNILEDLVREFPAVPEYRHLLACCYRDVPP